MTKHPKRAHEHPHVKAAREIAELANANLHQVAGHFGGGETEEHPRITRAREVADAAFAHHAALSTYMAAQADQAAQQQAAPMAGQAPPSPRS